MATCDSLQPVVLLTDVMEPMDPLLLPETQVEQTEPLNLCLNGTVFEGFAMIECYPRKKSEDDVIFVKEYKVNGEKVAKKASGQKGAPRRNPVRKARVTKRFKEYTDVGFDDEDFLENSAEEEESVDPSETFLAKNEDSEDWKVESVPKRGKQRKRVISRKMSYRLGRKRKINQVKLDEKKVSLNEMEQLIESNLVLLRDYIKDIKSVNLTKKTNSNLGQSERIANALEIFKQQVILLSVTKNMGGDLINHIF